jgi:hypothetical protein
VAGALAGTLVEQLTGILTLILFAAALVSIFL